MTDLRAWLESIGCGRYADSFQENSITSELLGDLTAAGSDVSEADIRAKLDECSVEARRQLMSES